MPASAKFWSALRPDRGLAGSLGKVGAPDEVRTGLGGREASQSHARRALAEIRRTVLRQPWGGAVLRFQQIGLPGDFSSACDSLAPQAGDHGGIAQQ